MPAGPQLIKAVESVLTDIPKTTIEIRNSLVGHYSLRAIRYALKALAIDNKAKVKRKRGYYVRVNEIE